MMKIKQLNEILNRYLNENTHKFVIEHGFKDKPIPLLYPEEPTKSMTDIIIKTRNLNLKHLSFLASIEDNGYFTDDGKFTEKGFDKFVKDFPEIKNLKYYVLKKGNSYVYDPTIYGFTRANQWNPVKTYTQDEIDYFRQQYHRTMLSIDCEEVNLF